MANEFEGASAAATADKADRMAALVNTIESLPPDERVVFILRYVQRLSTSEVARRLRLSVAQVQERCVKALCECRVRMGDLL